MRVPQRCRRVRSATIHPSHNSLPHIIRSIYPRILPVRFNPGQQFPHILAIAGIIGAPAAPRGWVGFDVQPDHSVEVGGDGRHDLVDLGGG